MKKYQNKSLTSEEDPLNCFPKSSDNKSDLTGLTGLTSGLLQEDPMYDPFDDKTEKSHISTQ